jgi:small subunit ribosomal protein S7
MTRKTIYIDRKISYSDKYNSPLLGKFINCMMLDGKKITAEKIVYEALEKASQKVQGNPLEVFEKIIANCKIQYIILKRKIGANTVQIPHVVDERKQISVSLLSLKNIVRELQNKSKKSIIECLEDVFVHSYKNEGPAVKKKEEIEQIALKNRVFSHYSWMSKKIKAKTSTKKSYKSNNAEL